MWIEFSKLVLCFYFCSTLASAYHTKLDFIKRDRYSSNNGMSGLNYNNYKVSKNRYPHLEKVKSRIDNMNTDGALSTMKDSPLKLRHKGSRNYWSFTTTTAATTIEADLFDTYGDLDADEDYENSLKDDDDYLDYEDDSDDSFFTDIVDVQAEEPTERPTIPPVSSLTKFKWKHFGSRTAIEKSRESSITITNYPEGYNTNAAIAHSQRINELGMCRKPSPKVISVQKEHPNPSKIYTPHCTILHRCGEDTGCCKYDMTCQYKTRVLVELFFYITTLGKRETKLEKLSFYNHTECECKANESSLSFKSSDIYNAPIKVERCKCPRHFKETFVNGDSLCTCDCEHDYGDCAQLKNGNEHLSMTDRICILNKECTKPVCQYGVYSKKDGKCPSKLEKIMEYSRIKVNVDNL